MNNDSDEIIEGMNKLNRNAYQFRQGSFNWITSILGHTSKNLEQMAILLKDSGVVSSLEEGKEFVPFLVGRTIAYRGIVEGESMKFEKSGNKYLIYLFDNTKSR